MAITLKVEFCICLLALKHIGRSLMIAVGHRQRSVHWAARHANAGHFRIQEVNNVSYAKKLLLLFIIVAACTFSAANAQERANMDLDRLWSEGYSVHAIIPIFSQLLMLSYPNGFKPVFENATGDNYYKSRCWRVKRSMSGLK